jgi:electron transfer flavoprotein alpha subunit
MARGFRRKGSGRHVRYTAQLDPLERATVAGLMEQVHTLLDPAPVSDDGTAGGDDFASIVAGLGMGVTVAAEDQVDDDTATAERDPALDRLLPTANREDEEAAAEFRRLTETGLRQRKAAGLEIAAAALRADGDKVRLDGGEARAFLVALTDVRLVLGERMGLRTDDDVDVLEAAADELDADDPLAYALAVYDFLTWLQETLASAMLVA